jgi:hypothetical protein
MSQTNIVSEEKKDAIRNLYLSGIGEEFIAMQVDLEIPIVISVLKQLGIYRSGKEEEVDAFKKYEIRKIKSWSTIKNNHYDEN